MDKTTDLFGDVPQPERAAPPRARPLTADDVRNQMLTLIATLREADEVPFEAGEMKKHIAMFPIMAQWLAPDEGEQLVFQFEAEVERLLKAA
jgi:predicted secreted protein